MWTFTTYNELYHHGILGMRWGKKNGPPYPLGVSDHSASEKKAGWKKSLNSGSSDSDYKKKKKNTNKIADAVINGEKDGSVKKKTNDTRSERKKIEDEYEADCTAVLETRNQKAYSRIKELSKSDPEAKRVLDTKDDYLLERYIKKSDDIKLDRIQEDYAEYMELNKMWRDDQLAKIKNAELTTAEKNEYLSKWNDAGYGPKDMVDDRLGITYEDVDKYFNNKENQSSNIQERLTTAKNKDLWDLDFLEYTQNKHWAGANETGTANKNKMLAEYQEYLENPDKYVSNRRNRMDPDNIDLGKKLYSLSEQNQNRAFSQARKQSVQNYSRVKSMRNSGMTYVQIANKLGISESTVWAMLYDED